MASVTILIKTATVVPAFGFDKDKFPSITMGVQQDAEDELSSDSKTEPITCESDGMAFPKPMTLEKLPRGATAQNVTFTFRGNVLGSTLGKSILSVADLVKHADFAVALKEQAIVLKHSAAPCPLRVDIDGVSGGALDGAMLSLDLDILEGSKAEAAKTVAAGDTRHANVFFAARSVLATRGGKTDTFCRLVLVTDSGAEHEVGRTETVMDDLSPDYNTYISLSYSLETATDEKSRTHLRFEICDPGTLSDEDKKKLANSPSKVRKNSGAYTVIGAQEEKLYDVHKKIEQQAGLYREVKQLVQLGELKGQIKDDQKNVDKGKYGQLAVVIEGVNTSDECVSFILGASKLYTNKLSMAPDPFLRIYRRLEASKGPVIEGIPNRCPVYASNYVAHTREASWSTTSIPMSLFTNGSMDAKMIIEVWDYQLNAEDRLIGSCEMTASAMLTNEHGDGPKDPRKQTYVKKHDLIPPSFFAATGSSVDRMASFVTGGIASKPGTFSVFQARKFTSPDLAAQHTDCFDVDTVLREKKASQPVVWEPLKDRRAKTIAKMRAGILVVDVTCGSRLAKSYRNFKNSFATCGVQKLIYRFAPFYKARKFVGAKFGTAFEAYFAFSYSLIQLNLLIALIWFLFIVFPQYILMDPNIVCDLINAFNVRAIAERAMAFSQQVAEAAGTNLTTSGVNLEEALGSCSPPVNSTFIPGVLAYDGYLPRISLDRLQSSFGIDAFGSDSYYFLDFAYVCCIFVMMSISLFTVVCRLGSQIGAVRETGSAARADGTGQVMEAIFGGWDHLATREGAVRQMRYSLCTQMKEGMGEAVRAAARKAKIKTNKEKRNAFLMRATSMTLSIIFVVCSVTIVFFVTSPSGALPAFIPSIMAEAPPGHLRDVRGFLEELAATFSLPIPIHTVIATLINVSSPIFIKLFVALEQWDSPETVIRQVLIRQILLKLANLIVIFQAQRIGSITQLQPVNPADGIDRCPESTASTQFIQLLIIDAIIAGPVNFVVKGLLYFPIKLCRKKPLGPLGKKGFVDLPTEIVNICYRQTMLVVGSLVSPWLFFVGIFSNTLIYFTKYLTISTMMQPPKKPFKASSIKKFFYGVLLLANIVGIYPVANFLTAHNNPNCGPLRDYKCAFEQSQYGFGKEAELGGAGFGKAVVAEASYCNEQFLQQRSNYAAFMEVLLPPPSERVDPMQALQALTGSGNSTLFSSLGGCDFQCIFSLVFSSIFSGVTMLMLTLLLCICVFFIRRQARRLTRELDAANEECSQEHHDKVKLLRYAGVSLD